MGGDGMGGEGRGGEGRGGEGRGGEGTSCPFQYNYFVQPGKLHLYYTMQ